MALDILSKQPTTLPSHLADPVTVPTSDLQSLPHFLFPTSNVFFAGSPAGFFLLLKRASLRPRLDHDKPGSDPDTNLASVCGIEGEYGCLPVDNIYNIINPYDPVSYRLNATVDADYARSLRPAWLPSASPGWFGSSTEDSALGGWFGTSTSTTSKAPSHSHSRTASRSHLSASAAGVATTTPATEESTSVTLSTLPLPLLLPHRLPSNVELETHDFSREEVAEKRMLALNDNGQIDFLVRYGGGPLDIQYLTMLGAHSSYWLLRDFVRAVVLECGRPPGREGVLRGMMAKKGRRGVAGV